MVNAKLHESTAYILRHLKAREPLFMGEFKQIPGASKGTEAVYGFGIHPDGKAHLVGSDYVNAEKIGEKLPIPKNMERILLAPSSLVRGEETIRHVFVGMCRNYARTELGLTDEDFSTNKGKRVLTQRGLHKITDFRLSKGLAESAYKNEKGEEDEGKELINQCHCSEINDGIYPGYRWIVQRGMQGDPRSEHPKDVADRAIADFAPEMTNYNCYLSGSHQPNIEIIAAALSGELGNNANEIWDRAGGNIPLGGGLMIKTFYNISSGVFESAELRRTPKEKMIGFDQELPISLDVLNKHLA